MKTIDYKKLWDAFVSAGNAMANHRERIDAMNVFPVPDGDTGSNMSGTIQYAVKEISSMSFEGIGEMTHKFSRGNLLGARGNSGVILSQIFKGFSVSLKDKKTANPFDIVSAFEQASAFAYKSVMKPVEGTILTVIRMVYENLSKTVTQLNTIEEIFELAVKFAREACDITPNFLPVLKEVGVTDSGGEGLYIILEAMHLSLIGKPVARNENSNSEGNHEFIMSGEDYEGEFGYCTEFILQLKNQKTFKKETFEQGILKLGTSVVIVHDEDILKVHLHILKPGKAFNYAQKYGEFIKLKSENMTIQANESNKAKKSNAIAQKPSKQKEGKISIISCNNGAGIIKEMNDLGVDFVIEGGQTNNPSAKDFIDAIANTTTDKVILLPNNPNILLVAQQVAQTSEKEIVIVPSRTQTEGIVAMINYDPTGDLHENKESMIEGMSDMKSGQITKASRTTKIKGVSVTEGEYLAISEKKILKSFKNKIVAAKHLCKKVIDKNIELVTIYYGEDANKYDAEEISSYLETSFDVEVEIKEGNQPVYDFLLSFE